MRKKIKKDLKGNNTYRRQVKDGPEKESSMKK